MIRKLFLGKALTIIESTGQIWAIKATKILTAQKKVNK